MAEWRAAGPSIRATCSAAADGRNAQPDVDSVLPTVHHRLTHPHRGTTARAGSVAHQPLHTHPTLSNPSSNYNTATAVSTPSATGGRLNASHHRQQKAERRRSGAFCCPSACDCYTIFSCLYQNSRSALSKYANGSFLI